MGASMRELIEEYAGGMRGGRQPKIIVPGGASAPWLTGQHLDTNLDFAAARHGRAGGWGRDTDNDDRTADVCAPGCGGLTCGIEAACWAGGVADIFCLMSSSTARSAAMFSAICSCLVRRSATR